MEEHSWQIEKEEQFSKIKLCMAILREKHFFKDRNSGVNERVLEMKLKRQPGILTKDFAVMEKILYLLLSTVD